MKLARPQSQKTLSKKQKLLLALKLGQKAKTKKASPARAAEAMEEKQK
jgi:hypothetical protein